MATENWTSSKRSSTSLVTKTRKHEKGARYRFVIWCFRRDDFPGVSLVDFEPYYWMYRLSGKEKT
jgi:hypothetical protein